MIFGYIEVTNRKRRRSLLVADAQQTRRTGARLLSCCASLVEALAGLAKIPCVESEDPGLVIDISKTESVALLLPDARRILQMALRDPRTAIPGICHAERQFGFRNAVVIL